MSNRTYDELMLDQKRKSSLIKVVAVYPQQAQTGHFDLVDLETRLDLLEAYWRLTILETSDAYCKVQSFAKISNWVCCQELDGH